MAMIACIINTVMTLVTSYVVVRLVDYGFIGKGLNYGN